MPHLAYTYILTPKHEPKYTMDYLFQILSHELGHNLGMNHDFIDPYTTPKNIFRDSTGASCTDVNGVMDYFVEVQQWTRFTFSPAIH